MIELTERQNFVLAAMAATPSANFAPVQIQKFFFLLDEGFAAVRPKFFNFKPYDYGPFDKSVYAELESLQQAKLASIDGAGGPGWQRRYVLTGEGQKVGEAHLAKYPQETQGYLKSMNEWVRSMPFAQLVGSVYNAHPDMRANSIFRE